MIKVTLKAQTEQIGRSNSTLQDHIEFSGLNAGVCYMPDTFDALEAQPQETKLKRGLNTINREHHSVTGHVSMEVVIEGIPKICAMMLNNLGEYNTSEKSARYTVMDSVSGMEQIIYHKWVTIFKNLICEEYDCYHPADPQAVSRYKENKCRYSPSQVTKLALENARYLLSVFTPTVMTYTTSLRQFNYIIDWCNKFYKENFNGESKFFTELAYHMQCLGKQLEQVLYVEGLRETKNRCFNLINKDERSFQNIPEIFANVYQTKYKATFSHLAQAQRHRTIDYVMYFDGECKDFYVPPILHKHSDLVVDWLRDATLLADKFPQCTLVDVLEQGTAENFILKCKERECSCAQLEIQNQTILTHKKYEESELLTPELKAYFENYKKHVRCGFGDYKCNAPCTWGIKAPSRLI